MESKQRILLVDDEQINLEFFEVMLSNLGFDIRKADNGLDALEILRHWKPDLIMLDNIMPRLSGWEVTKLLKTSPEYAEFADIPIVMFSAMDDVRDKVEGLELGADDYITKPFNFSEVLARLRAILRTHELVRQIERREARMKVTEDLVDRLVGYTAGLRRTLGELADGARSADGAVREALAELDELDSAVASLKSEADELRRQETALHAIKRNLRS